MKYVDENDIASKRVRRVPEEERKASRERGFDPDAEDMRVLKGVGSEGGTFIPGISSHSPNRGRGDSSPSDSDFIVSSPSNFISTDESRIDKGGSRSGGGDRIAQRSSPRARKLVRHAYAFVG